MSTRTIPWGTVLAGTIALGLAVLVVLTEVAGVSIPLRSAGPGFVIVIGLLILIAGLFAVLRSSRSAQRSQTTQHSQTTQDSQTTPDAEVAKPAGPATSATIPVDTATAKDTLPEDAGTATGAPLTPRAADPAQSSH